MSKLIVANWKMHGTLEKINNDLEFYLSGNITNRSNIIFAFPTLYVAYVKKIFEHKFARSKLASQDLSIHNGFGAYTGEISAEMLVDCGVSYAIIGHSERRLFADTEDILIKKLDAAVNADLIPIYCIGESIKLRESKQYLKFLQHQLDCLTMINGFTNLIIAYEPIWAIGTNLTPSKEQIEEIAAFIQGYIAKKIANIKLSILYGGSVNANNAKDILNISLIDGVLVGGSSLKVDEFSKICNASGNILESV